MPIRSVGAAFGWMWSAEYEARVVEQVHHLIKPLADWMAEAGCGDIPARCIGIWSLYYVGYRHAVMNRGTAKECLEGIKPSLRFFLEAPEEGLHEIEAGNSGGATDFRKPLNDD